MTKFKNGNASIVSLQRELWTSGGEEIVNIWGINYQPSFVYVIFWIHKFSGKNIFFSKQKTFVVQKENNSAFAEKQKVKRVGFAEDRKKVVLLRLLGVARWRKNFAGN